jgi:hypothetical protein
MAAVGRWRRSGNTRRRFHFQGGVGSPMLPQRFAGTENERGFSELVGNRRFSAVPVSASPLITVWLGVRVPLGLPHRHSSFANLRKSLKLTWRAVRRRPWASSPRRAPAAARALAGHERRAVIGNLAELGPTASWSAAKSHPEREIHYLRAMLIERARSFAPRSIMLKARRSQAGEAVLIDRLLPGGEFIGREHIAAAGLFKRNHALANSVDDLGLATDHPPLRRDGR